MKIIELAPLIPRWHEMQILAFNRKKEKKRKERKKNLWMWQYVFYANTKAAVMDSRVWEREQAKNKWNCSR